MVPYGYGGINETPAVRTFDIFSQDRCPLTLLQVYMLQYFTPDILKFFSGQHPGYVTGEYNFI